MKKCFIAFILVLFFAPLWGQTVAWDDTNPPEAQVVEYRLYQSDDGGVTWDLIGVIPVGTQTYELSLVVDTGVYTFSVTAANHVGESDRSNLLEIQTNRPTPVEIRVSK